MATSKQALEQSNQALEQARQHIQALERRLGLNSTSSSKPPSTDSAKARQERPRPTPSGRRRGGQKGHVAKALVVQEKKLHKARSQVQAQEEQLRTLGTQQLKGVLK